MNTGSVLLQFRPAMIVADALALHPKARWVFAAYHIRGCNGCDHANRETLEEVASAYNIPLERLLTDLNGLLACPEGSNHRRDAESTEVLRKET